MRALTKKISDQFWRIYCKISFFFIFHFLKILPICERDQPDICFTNLFCEFLFANMWRKVGFGRNRKAKQRQLPWCVSCPADAINLAPHSCSQSTYIKAHHQENIARITQVSWKVKFNCLSVLSDLFAAFISLEVVAKCLPKWPAWKVSMVIFVRKLVEGCTQASLRFPVTW